MEQRRHRNAIGGIFLLTDGQDYSSRGNLQGIVDRARAAQCAIYSFGFGTDHDSAMLSGIAESAQTPFTYVEQVDSIKEAFAGTVGGLMCILAQNIELRIIPDGGCSISKIHTPFSHHSGDSGAVSVLIPDAFAG